MNRNWRYIFLPFLSLFMALAVFHPAFASQWPIPRTYDAPEMDPKLAIEGIALAGAAAGLLWERIRRRR